MERIAVTIRIPEALKEKADQVAREKGYSLNALLTSLIEKGLINND